MEGEEIVPGFKEKPLRDTPEYLQFLELLIISFEKKIREQDIKISELAKMNMKLMEDVQFMTRLNMSSTQDIMMEDEFMEFLANKYMVIRKKKELGE